MNLKKKVETYEAALHALADWNFPAAAFSTLDDNGAATKWARDLLTQTGMAPIQTNSKEEA